jgi:hypothetical protein
MSFAEQGLHDKIRHHAPVLRVHARAEGVEDPRHFDTQFVLTKIVEEQSLGAAFSFIITRARADRIDVSPIVFRLRMDLWVAVHFGRRCLHNFRLHPLGEAQHVDGAVNAGLGRLHRVVLVMGGRSGTRKIVDLVDFKIDREGDIVPDELEMFVVEQMLDVPA